MYAPIKCDMFIYLSYRHVHVYATMTMMPAMRSRHLFGQPCT